MDRLAAADFFRAFNAAAADFFSDLRTAFPKSGELRSLQGAHELAQASSLRLPLETFSRAVVAPYGERLRSKDEAFFISHDYRDVAAGSAGAQDMVSTLKGLWAGMSRDHRDCVMAHIERLMSIHDAAEMVIGHL